ncbi:unnamed protein product [Miscanthus lutarioriparius]|uniref:Senescence regulator n=1 Tax=Miscanthus lutarioriparius TaxID=422564 RepID=A0A811PV13_9POAL|nr:unnamed protein product [Miscanthus lutarioriparius]
MARPTSRAYLHFAQAPHGVVVPTGPAAAGEEFDESDIWGAFAPSAAPAEPARARPFLATQKAPAPDGRAAHGSLPVKIPDWSKILGHAYRPGYHYGGGAGDWELDDDEDSVDLVPPHELAGRRRAASLSLSMNGVVGRTLKVRDAVWKRTTGFQD